MSGSGTGTPCFGMVVSIGENGKMRNAPTSRSLRDLTRDFLSPVKGLGEDRIRPGLVFEFDGPEGLVGSFYWSPEGYIEADIVDSDGAVRMNLCSMEEAQTLDAPIEVQTTLDEEPCSLEDALSYWDSVVGVSRIRDVRLEEDLPA